MRIKVLRSRISTLNVIAMKENALLRTRNVPIFHELSHGEIRRRFLRIGVVCHHPEFGRAARHFRAADRGVDELSSIECAMPVTFAYEQRNWYIDMKEPQKLVSSFWGSVHAWWPFHSDRAA